MPKIVDASKTLHLHILGGEAVKYTAEVIWKKVSGMPKVLDFSKCKRVEFEKCDFGNCKEIIFQNQKQAKDAKIGASLSFRQLRKIKYLEEPQQNKNKFSIFDRLR